jgi:predicted ABC-type transport system involved in lysophospholipase L1 biosynthesis ATPase subunit
VRTNFSYVTYSNVIVNFSFHLIQMLGSLENVTLVECPVVRAEYRGNPEYPYRKHAQLQLKAVPTLYRWTPKGNKPRLVEGQILDETLMTELIDM